MPPQSSTPQRGSAVTERVLIRQATPADADAIVETLVEAARWVEELDGTIMSSITVPPVLTRLCRNQGRIPEVR